VKLSLVITVLWWGLFSIPFLKNIKQVHGIDKPQSDFVKQTFVAIGRTAKRIFQHKGIFYFIIAYFFYIDGVGTIINISTAYGATLGLNSTGMIIALLVTQLIAFPCAIWFSRLSKRFGSAFMLVWAVCLYLVICIVGFVMGFGLETDLFGADTGLVLFWTLAVLVGTVQGGIQAISRSHFAKLVPPEYSGEFFGFFDIFGKFAAVMGPALYAYIRSAIPARSSLAILSIAALFIIALVIFAVKGKEMKASETHVA
jgi:UMF1 family MFS transporter